MCSPEAQLALTVFSKMQQHNAGVEKANSTAKSNFDAKNSASAALFDDYGEIDVNKKQAGAEKSAEKFALKREKIAEMARQLNLNVGNATAIYKDVGADTNAEYTSIDRAFNQDLLAFNRQENEAYSAYQNTINSLPVPEYPSQLALAIDIAGAGATYGSNPNRKYFKKDSGEVVAP
ncbi:hypothetical protein P120_gp34 [Pelagibacter phage HTVC120P]|nr:hypothetical protein P120_gp34 [Pelagibacter phage HTVC120P]